MGRARAGPFHAENAYIVLATVLLRNKCILCVTPKCVLNSVACAVRPGEPLGAWLCFLLMCV